MTALDGTLSYGMPHEYWHADVVGATRELWVSYRSKDLSVQESFLFEETDAGGYPAVECRIFSDSWTVWTVLPGLFRALADAKPETLKDVAAVLEAFGGVDTTAREHPGKQGPALRAVREFARMNSPENARLAAEALMAFASDPYEEVPF